MSIEEDWEAIRGKRGGFVRGAGMGALRITLLFGSAAVALALIIAPIAEGRTRNALARKATPELDTMSTGSIGAAGRRNSYTIRRSVLQNDPTAECIIRANGLRGANC